MRMRTFGLLLIVILGFTSPALADDVVDGQLGPGALYRLVRPTNWNGSLLLYSHGYVTGNGPVSLPSEADLFVALLAPRGFAIAFSSYSENGWAVKDGAQRTHQLLGIFASRFGAPSRVYMGGASMGGLIAIELIERYPERFAGALAACAVSGGSRAQFDYLGNTRALFDLFYPGVLPGNAGSVPDGLDLATQIALPAAAAIQANPAGALTLASITQTPIPFSNGAQLVESVVTAVTGHAATASDLVTKMPRGEYFDNSAVHYTSPVLPAPTLAGINALVGRYEASPAALNYLEQNYQPSGALQMPMLMLSTSLDPVVPGFHRAIYHDLVTAAGNSDLLVQRTISRYGHCVFTPTEIATAFLDLVAWVELGIKPTP
jgi:pimeloyl-ACP methyl ester carboxylesterase